MFWKPHQISETSESWFNHFKLQLNHSNNRIVDRAGSMIIKYLCQFVALVTQSLPASWIEPLFLQQATTANSYVTNIGHHFTQRDSLFIKKKTKEKTKRKTVKSSNNLELIMQLQRITNIRKTTNFRFIFLLLKKMQRPNIGYWFIRDVFPTLNTTRRKNNQNSIHINQ